MNREKETMKDLAAMRQHYELGTLTRDKISSNPFHQFVAWFDDAKKANILEANAMTLCSINPGGFPTSRVVLLKEMDSDGYVFYTNYDSEKGLEFIANPHVAVNFFWKRLERQVRIRGTVEKISRARSQKYFNSRPKASQIGAWVSKQSSVIVNRERLETIEKELVLKYENAEIIPIPPHWGGYKISPTYFEFWQGRPSRLHDRFRYMLDGDDWSIDRLAP